jgi:hypothetical protein
VEEKQMILGDSRNAGNKVSWKFWRIQIRIFRLGYVIVEFDIPGRNEFPTFNQSVFLQ